MSVAVNVTNVESGQGVVRVFGTLTPSGNYVANGDAVDFTKATGLSIPSQSAPISFRVEGAAAYVYKGVKGAINACKFVVQETGAALSGALADLAAAAYPAGITGDTITFEAVFPKLQ